MPTEEEWENHRAVLEDLYMDHTLQYVMEHMKRRYRWDAKRNQYEKWLVRKWRICKNVLSSVWKAIYPHVRAFELSAIPFEVWINGIKKSPDEIHRELQRLVRKFPGLLSDLPQALPEGVIIRETTPSQMHLANVQLPFHAFTAHLRSYVGLPGRGRQQTHAGGASDEEYPGILHQSLQLAIAAHSMDDQPILPLSSPAIPRMFNSTFHQNVVFLMSNDLAGLNAHASERIVQSLQHETSETLFQRLRSASHSYTTQAIILTLFKMAIEIGDSITVRLLLGASLLGVGADQIVCRHTDRNYTAIERAALLGHRDIIGVLLDQGADVNLSFGPRRKVHLYQFDKAVETRGALNHFADNLLKKFRWKVHDTTYSTREMEMDWECFGTLARADGKIDSRMIKDLAVYDSHGYLLQMLLSEQAHKNHQQWCEDGVFQAFLEHGDGAVMSKLLDIMIETGINLSPTSNDEYYDSDCLVNAVARRGDLRLMQQLLGALHSLTVDMLALECAIGSGNEDLVRFLLDSGARINSHPHSHSCPLAAAIRLQRKSLISLVLDHMDPKSMCNSNVFVPCWRVAVEVGSTEWIRKLLTLCVDVSPWDLGDALKIAIANGMRDVAFELIDAGADTNYWDPERKFETPLISAVIQQDSTLVHALLETNAGEYRYAYDDRLLELAVSWGNRDVVAGILLSMGSLGRGHPYHSEALTIAIQRRDCDMLDLLMKARECSNAMVDNGRDTTALIAAVQTDDVEMVRYVLESGADPHDSRALLKALEQSSDVLELIIKEYAKRYRRWRPGWGAKALKAVIYASDLPLFDKLLTAGADPLASQISHGTHGFVWDEDDFITPFGYAISRGESGGLQLVEHLLQSKGREAYTPQTTVISKFEGLISNYKPGIEYHNAASGITAMLAAIKTKSRSMVGLMLRYGADVNHPASFGINRTPLQMATEVGSMELVALLLDKGADVNGAAAKRGGATALQLAAINGDLPVARLLLENGARLELPPSPFGLNALEGAALNGRLDMVAFLLNVGASIYNPKLTSGRQQLASAIALAKEGGYYYIGDMLKQYLETGNVAVTEPKATGTDGLELFDYDKYASETGT